MTNPGRKSPSPWTSRKAVLSGRTDGDAACLGVPDAEELVLRRIDGSLVAFFYALAVGVFNMIDGAGEYPRMETFQGFFLAGLEDDFGIAHMVVYMQFRCEDTIVLAFSKKSSTFAVQYRGVEQW